MVAQGAAKRAASLTGALDGRQMAAAARLSRPDLKILFVTGYAENAVLGDGDLDPVMRVTTKPFNMNALAARIGAWVESPPS